MRRIPAWIFTLLFALLPLSSLAAPPAEEYRIPASLGNLYGVLQLPEEEGPVPLLILCHGFGSSYLWSQDYADHFVKGGYAVFGLDFCGGGVISKSDGTMLQMSVLTEARDLNAVLDFFRDDPRFSAFYLRGESQGGFVASYVAAQRPEEIKGLVLEYPAYVLQDDAKRRRLPDGSFPEVSTLLGMRIGRVYSEDVLSFDIYEHMAAYTGPVLILHGDKDRLVPLSYSERAAGVFRNAELVVLPGQGHGFQWAGRTEAKEKELAFLNSLEAR